MFYGCGHREALNSALCGKLLAEFAGPLVFGGETGIEHGGNSVRLAQANLQLLFVSKPTP